MSSSGHNHARAFIRARQHTPDHHYLGTRCQSFRHISGLTDPTIGDNGYPVRTRCFCTFNHCGQLWHARPSDNSCYANRTGANANLYSICTGIDQSFCSIGCCNIYLPRPSAFWMVEALK